VVRPQWGRAGQGSGRGSGLPKVGQAILPVRLDHIRARQRNLTADTALRLSRYFGTSADFWMNLQSACELDLARQRMARPSSASQSAARRCGKPGGTYDRSVSPRLNPTIEIAAVSPFEPDSPSRRDHLLRANDFDVNIACKARRLERQDGLDSMDLHRGDQSCIMGGSTRNLTIDDQRLPSRINRRRLRQQDEHALQARQFRRGPRWRHPKPVLGYGPGSDRPQLDQILGNDVEYCALFRQSLDGAIRGAVQRMMRL